MTKILVKICGLKDEQAVQAAVAAGADYAGFVHFPASPRHLSLARAAELKALLPASVQAVAVLVDPDDALLSEVFTILKPDYVQLHGRETPQRLRAIKKIFGARVIKSISVAGAEDLAAAAAYADTADRLLFDTRIPAASLPGGNGRPFDWSLLSGQSFSLPWFLSGGLSAGNVGEAIHISGAKAVDVSSGVEISPGVKNAPFIHDFIRAARNTKNNT